MGKFSSTYGEYRHEAGISKLLACGFTDEEDIASAQEVERKLLDAIMSKENDFGSKEVEAVENILKESLVPLRWVAYLLTQAMRDSILRRLERAKKKQGWSGLVDKLLESMPPELRAYTEKRINGAMNRNCPDCGACEEDDTVPDGTTEN